MSTGLFNVNAVCEVIDDDVIIRIFFNMFNGVINLKDNVHTLRKYAMKVYRLCAVVCTFISSSNIMGMLFTTCHQTNMFQTNLDPSQVFCIVDLQTESFHAFAYLQIEIFHVFGIADLQI